MRKINVFLFFLILPAIVFSAGGVGVTTGKIVVSEPLKAGGIRNLGTLGVVNTGSSAGEYEVGVEYHEQQTQLWPPRQWFRFEPRTFYLEPGQAINVKIQLALPLNAKPGDYFAYMEARSLNKDNIPGGARIGVAAAAKLYFTITPANIFLAIYFRIQSLIKIYSPWSWVVIGDVLGAIILLLLRVLFRKFFKIQISIKKKEENPINEDLTSSFAQTNSYLKIKKISSNPPSFIRAKKSFTKKISRTKKANNKNKKSK